MNYYQYINVILLYTMIPTIAFIFNTSIIVTYPMSEFHWTPLLYSRIPGFDMMTDRQQLIVV